MVDGGDVVKKKGAVISFSVIAVMAICITLLFVGVSTGYYLVNSWRANAIMAQADEIDKALVSYARHHKGVHDNGMHYDSAQAKLVYTREQDYPLYLDDFGEIAEKANGSSEEEYHGFLSTKIKFCKEGEDPRYNLYKFKYTPLDGNGQEITVTSSSPIVYYNLEVFYKNEKGDIIRYVSPGSYENIKDNEKPL